MAGDDPQYRIEAGASHSLNLGTEQPIFKKADVRGGGEWGEKNF